MCDTLVKKIPNDLKISYLAIIIDTWNFKSTANLIPLLYRKGAIIWLLLGF